MSAEVPALPLASARRRIAAFIVDLLILWAIGHTLGRYAADFLIALGPWGRLFGFAIGAAYFGTLNSRIGGAATPGKRVLGLRVVDREGRAIAAPRAQLRYLPLGIPFFLNNAPLPALAMNPPAAALLSVLVFGLGGCALYLLLCNRATRQTLHDLLAATYVVDRSGSAPRPLWRGHYVICALIVLAAAAAPWQTARWAESGAFAPLLRTQQALALQPWISQVSVTRGVTRLFGIGPRTDVYGIEVNAAVVDRDLHSQARYDQAALMVLQNLDDLAPHDLVTVTLRYGYDIGIASDWVSQQQTHAAGEWRAYLGADSYVI